VITPHFDPYDDEHLNEKYYRGDAITGENI
jgi:hypothetical protein